MVSTQLCTLGDVVLASSNTLRNLVVIFEVCLLTSFFPVLFWSDADKLVYVCVTLRLDHCKSLLSGCSERSLESQFIQNTEVGVPTGTRTQTVFLPYWLLFTETLLVLEFKLKYFFLHTQVLNN